MKWVGNKNSGNFEAQTVVLTIYDKKRGLTLYPYIIENGKKLQQSRCPSR